MLNVLFFAVLEAVEELVELRVLYGDSQRIIKEAESEIDTLKEQVALLESMLR